MIARNSVISYSWKGLAVLGLAFLLWTFSQSFLSQSWDTTIEKTSHIMNRAHHRKIAEIAFEFPSNITTVPTGEPIRGENNIMFVETSCLVNKSNKQKILSVRQTCSIESAAKMNPEAKVYLFHSCPFYLDAQTMARRLVYYSNVKFWMMSLESLVTGTPLQTWDYNSALKSSQWPLEHSSDVVRFLLLWKYGGLYMDLDFIVIRSLAPLEKNFVNAETANELGSSVIKLNHNATGHRLAEICVQQLSKDFRGDVWSHNGPQRITNALLELCKTDKLSDISPDSCDVTIHTPRTFFPVAYWEWKLLFNESDEEDVAERIKDSFGVHIWNKLSSEEKVYPGSKQPYSILASEFCPLAYSTAVCRWTGVGAIYEEGVPLYIYNLQCWVIQKHIQPYNPYLRGILSMAEGGGEEETLEGFLCPICKADFGTALQLHTHFQEEHTEDQDVLKSLKDLLGKARKKILKMDIFSIDYETQSKSVSAAHVTSSYNAIEVEPQEIGVTRKYTQTFRAIRNNRLEHYATETNKLLIRLDKLLHNIPSDPVKRKAHEQAVVPWIKDKDVKLCPTCAKNFHVARRKHHCRLCGAIMCHDCTQFLTFSVAKKMTNPAFAQQSFGSSQSRTSTNITPPSSFDVLHRSNSNSSLNSVLSLVDAMTGEQNFHLCIHCKQLLDTRENLKESRSLKPIISQFYERLHSYQTEADELAVLYNKMCQFLNCGETTFHLADAQALHVKLLKLAESIDSLSNKIAILGIKDMENPPRGKTLQLQQKIRIAATSYLEDQLLTLPALPTEAQLKAHQDRRRQEVSVRIQQEKQLAAIEAYQAEMRRKRDSPQRRVTQNSGLLSQKTSEEEVVLDTGWRPEAAQMFDSDDPMIQQMNIIRSYIKQARSAYKYDEVAILENNLKDLREEYWRQQQTQSQD